MQSPFTLSLLLHLAVLTAFACITWEVRVPGCGAKSIISYVHSSRNLYADAILAP